MVRRILSAEEGDMKGIELQDAMTGGRLSLCLSFGLRQGVVYGVLLNVDFGTGLD